MQARDIMTSPVITVGPDATVAAIAALLLEKRISGLPVVDAAGALVGIVTEGDLLGRPELEGERDARSWLHFFGGRSLAAADFVKTHGNRAAEVMTRKVVTVPPEEDAGAIARLLETRRIKRVPVVEDGRVIGIVSRANLLRSLVALRIGQPAAPPAAGDAAIRAGLRRTLAQHDWLADQHVNLVVKDGIVHVWGIVGSAEKRRALRVAIERVPGVRGVEEHLSPDIFADMGFRQG